MDYWRYREVNKRGGKAPGKATCLAGSPNEKRKVQIVFACKNVRQSGEQGGLEGILLDVIGRLPRTKVDGIFGFLLKDEKEWN